MKKIFLITALIFGMISTSFANDIEFKNKVKRISNLIKKLILKVQM